MEYRFSLDNTAKKYFCPHCRRRSFVRFLDRERGEYLPDDFGRCDREFNCGFFRSPYHDAEFLRSYLDEKTAQARPYVWKAPPPPPVVPFPRALYLPFCRSWYREQPFFRNLCALAVNRFPEIDKNDVISLITDVFRSYGVGTLPGENNRPTGSLFPFINKSRQITAVQWKAFDNRNKTKKTSFLHRLLPPHAPGLAKYCQNQSFVRALFGEHLLTSNPGNVVIVEAPKTALYGAVFQLLKRKQRQAEGRPANEKPAPLWLATYNAGRFKYETLKVLTNCTAFVFPDTDAHERWAHAAEAFGSYLRAHQKTRLHVSPLLLSHAKPSDSADLADFLFSPGFDLCGRRS